METIEGSLLTAQERTLSEMWRKGLTLEEMLLDGRNQLELAGIADASVDAWILFSHETGLNRAGYFLRKEEPVEESVALSYYRMIYRRCDHVPLQYITGEQEFMGLPFLVSPDVLIPRQDTENLVETVLPFVKGKRVLDVCTGSGCIAVALAVLGNTAECAGVDISSNALAIARKNAVNNQAEVEFFQGDLMEGLQGTYDIIVSNPPYIPPKVIEGLMEEVKEHEPRIALDGGEDGLDFYRRITEQSKKHLGKNGYLFYEIGHDQREDVMRIMREQGYSEVVCRKDYAGNDRVVFGRLEDKECLTN